LPNRKLSPDLNRQFFDLKNLEKEYQARVQGLKVEYFRQHQFFD